MPDVLPAQASSPRRLCECPLCGFMHALPELHFGATASCIRCGSVLSRRRRNPLERPLAMSITGMLLLLIAVSMPFMAVSLGGRGVATHFSSGAIALDDFDLWELTIVVLGTTIVAPFARLACMIAVLAGIRLKRPPRRLYMLFRWTDTLRPWSMVEVYMLGIFVAYSKLVDLAHVDVGPAVYALGALMLATATMDATMDPDAVWGALERRRLVADPARLDNPHPASGTRPIACLSCSLVTQTTDGDACPRCGARLHRRKPDSQRRAGALLAAAVIMYLPANMFPVLTLISLGRGQPSTILGGVMELAASHLWALAILVFVASITVPVLKILGLTTMLISVRRRSAGYLRDRTLVYKVVEFIGRWSMIDVFMISILTGLVHLGFIADVHPGFGALAFASVVILTMLSAEAFDPRLMWDAARRNPGHEF